MKKTLVLLLVIAMIVIANVTPAFAAEGITLNDGIDLANGETIYRFDGNSYEAIGTYTVSADYPLAGQRYVAYVDGKLNPDYDAVWTADGRLWQPNLPGNDRETHTVAISLPVGYSYKFHGVEAVLNLDTNCDEAIDQPDFIVRSNETTFDVPDSWGKEVDGVRVIWATVWSSTDSGGFEIQTVGPIGGQ